MSTQLQIPLPTPAPTPDSLPQTWASQLPYTATRLAHSLVAHITEARRTTTIYPPEGRVFAALALTPPDRTRVVILGQDPYHGAGQAHGLAFSVPHGIPPPPSLRNIFKELDQDIPHTPHRHTTDLTRWATQGVLLLNTALTVEEAKAGSHARLGWHAFTDAVVETLAHRHTHLVFILWGNHAQQRRHLIDETNHLVITSPHPSPLSASRGFFGSRPFSRTNAYLAAHGGTPIDWI